MSEEKNENFLINEKSMEVLITKFIPTSQYFERSFEMLQNQIIDLRNGQKELKLDIDRRFEQVDQRFGQVDQRFEQVDKRFDQVDQRFEQVDQRFEQVEKRFEQVDKRFEQVDKRFDQIALGQKEIKAEMDQKFSQLNDKLDTIIARMDVKIDAGLRENRMMSIRLFSFAMVFSAISMAGLLAKMTGLF